MKKLILSLLIGVAIASAQSAPIATTLALQITPTSQQALLSSTTGVRVGEWGYIDREAFLFTGLAGTVATIQRGIGGTKATGHTTSSVLYVAPTYLFVSGSQAGACFQAQTVIDAGSGNQYTCSGAAGASWTIVGGGTGAAAWGGITGAIANQGDLSAALGLLAPLAGPTFTGTVTAPAFAGALTGNASTATNLNTGVVLSVAHGGSGTTTPGIVAGTNVTLSGTWPNQTVNATGGGSSFTSAAGAPVSACAGANVFAFYGDITYGNAWVCLVTAGTYAWSKLLSTSDSGAYLVTAQEGGSPGTPASGYESMFFSTTYNTSQVINSAGNVSTMVFPGTPCVSPAVVQAIGLGGGITCGTPWTALYAPLASPTFTGTLTGATGAFTTLSATTGTFTNINTALALLAPLASPTFTGTVTGPTAQFTNINGSQTQNFIYAGPSTGGSGVPGWRAMVANDVPSLPLYATLAGGAVFTGAVSGPSGVFTNITTAFTTQNAAIALLAPLASPTFTGTVTLPGQTFTSCVSGTNCITLAPNASQSGTGNVSFPAMTAGAHQATLDDVATTLSYKTLVLPKVDHVVGNSGAPTCTVYGGGTNLGGAGAACAVIYGSDEAFEMTVTSGSSVPTANVEGFTIAWSVTPNYAPVCIVSTDSVHNAGVPGATPYFYRSLTTAAGTPFTGIFYLNNSALAVSTTYNYGVICRFQ